MSRIEKIDNNKFSNPVFSIIMDYHACTNCSVPQADNSTVGRGKNSRFKYKFSQTIFLDQMSRISIGSVSIPYSWRNITSAYGNNKISYVFNGMTRNITVPDGFYALSDLYAYVQYVMVTCGDYLIDNNKNYVYFLDITYNTPVYRLQFNSYAVSYPLATGWTVPTTWGSSINNSYVTSSGTPTISSATITSGSGTLANAYFIITNSTTTTRNPYIYFGLASSTPGQVPYAAYSSPGTSTVSQLGDNAPRQSEVDSLVLNSPQVKNVFTSNTQNAIGTNVLSAVQINTTYGNNIDLAQFFTTWMPFNTSTMRELEIVITDQEGNDVFLEDMSTTMELIITYAQ